MVVSFSIPVYIMTVLLFTAFLNINIHGEKVIKIITAIAPATLGVYLIHAHANVSPWSWRIVNLPAKMGSPFFPLVQIAIVCSVFMICTTIDYMRKHVASRIEQSKIFEERFNKLTGKLKQRFTTTK